jgi:hypothetical protein
MQSNMQMQLRNLFFFLQNEYKGKGREIFLHLTIIFCNFYILVK